MVVVGKMVICSGGRGGEQRVGFRAVALFEKKGKGYTGCLQAWSYTCISLVAASHVLPHLQH